MSPRQHIVYQLEFQDAPPHEYNLIIDAHSKRLQIDESFAPEAWAKLEFKQCKNCTLNATASPYCPLAKSVAWYGLHNLQLPSYTQVKVRVIMDERIISVDTTLQRAMRSLFGLISALSGCPHTAFLSPLGIYHAPFISEREGLLRIVSLHLLKMHLFDSDSTGIDQLKTNYQQLELANHDFADRLRHALQSDAPLNALVLLNFFAQYNSSEMANELHDLRAIF